MIMTTLNDIFWYNREALLTLDYSPYKTRQILNLLRDPVQREMRSISNYSDPFDLALLTEIEAHLKTVLNTREPRPEQGRTRHHPQREDESKAEPMSSQQEVLDFSTDVLSVAVEFLKPYDGAGFFGDPFRPPFDTFERVVGAVKETVLAKHPTIMFVDATPSCRTWDGYVNGLLKGGGTLIGYWFEFRLSFKDKDGFCYWTDFHCSTRHKTNYFRTTLVDKHFYDFYWEDAA